MKRLKESLKNLNEERTVNTELIKLKKEDSGTNVSYSVQGRSLTIKPVDSYNNNGLNLWFSTYEDVVKFKDALIKAMNKVIVKE